MDPQNGFQRPKEGSRTKWKETRRWENASAITLSTGPVTARRARSRLVVGPPHQTQPQQPWRSLLEGRHRLRLQNPATPICQRPACWSEHDCGERQLPHQRVQALSTTNRAESFWEGRTSDVANAYAGAYTMKCMQGINTYVRLRGWSFALTVPARCVSC